MKLSILAFVGAAIAEIVGCVAFWAWLKMGKSIWWVLPGVLSLAVFASLLTLVDSEHAGRSYATYGGIYIAAAVIWMWVAEGVRPDRWDILGVCICLVGTGVILWAPRALTQFEIQVPLPVGQP